MCVCAYLSTLLLKWTLYKLSRKMMPNKRATYSDIMTIKRDKFSSIIRILELDIFNGCNLSNGAHDVTKSNQVFCGVVVSHCFDFNPFLTRCTIRVKTHRLSFGFIHLLFLQVHAIAIHISGKKSCFAPMFYDNRFYGKRFFYSHFVIDNDANATKGHSQFSESCYFINCAWSARLSYNIKF